MSFSNSESHAEPEREQVEGEECAYSRWHVGPIKTLREEFSQYVERHLAMHCAQAMKYHVDTGDALD